MVTCSQPSLLNGLQRILHLVSEEGFEEIGEHLGCQASVNHHVRAAALLDRHEPIDGLLLVVLVDAQVVEEVPHEDSVVFLHEVEQHFECKLVLQEVVEIAGGDGPFRPGVDGTGSAPAIANQLLDALEVPVDFGSVVPSGRAGHKIIGSI